MAPDWRYLAESLIGPSHEAEGSPCQDANAASVVGAGDGSCLVACVADGAGSAKHSDQGSQIACQTILELAVEHHKQHEGFDSLGREEVLGWLHKARERINTAAVNSESRAREFATTLLAVVLTPSKAFFFQVGDGAIILGRRGKYGVVFWPQSGEYANSTNFLTGDRLDEQWEFAAAIGPFDEVALLTDGLERLALEFETQTPHLPFCQPLFAGLRSSDDLEQLGQDLRGLLASAAVNSRSDDDRTLVLATRGGAS